VIYNELVNSSFVRGAENSKLPILAFPFLESSFSISSFKP